MLQSKAAVCIEDAKQLAAQVIYWQQNPLAKEQAGAQALKVVQSNQGALKKLLALIDNSGEQLI